MITIERYDRKYQTDIEWLAQCFHEESLKEYAADLSLEVLQNTIDEVRDDTYLMIVDDVAVGIIAGRPADIPLTKEMVWQELIWFVLKEHRRHGVKFLREVQVSLKHEGYVAMGMACMENSMKDKLFRLYGKLGFQPVEHHFIGRL